MLMVGRGDLSAVPLLPINIAPRDQAVMDLRMAVRRARIFIQSCSNSFILSAFL